MQSITASVISGVILVIMTMVINLIATKIRDRYHEPKWKTYFDKKLNENRKSQLRCEITLFHADRREEKQLNSTERQWLCDSMEEYHRLGGNSFVDTIFNEIMTTWEVIN